MSSIDFSLCFSVPSLCTVFLFFCHLAGFSCLSTTQSAVCCTVPDRLSINRLTMLLVLAIRKWLNQLQNLACHSLSFCIWRGEQGGLSVSVLSRKLHRQLRSFDIANMWICIIGNTIWLQYFTVSFCTDVCMHLTYTHLCRSWVHNTVITCDLYPLTGLQKIYP